MHQGATRSIKGRLKFWKSVDEVADAERSLDRIYRIEQNSGGTWRDGVATNPISTQRTPSPQSQERKRRGEGRKFSNLTQRRKGLARQAATKGEGPRVLFVSPLTLSLSPLR